MKMKTRAATRIWPTRAARQILPAESKEFLELERDPVSGNLYIRRANEQGFDLLGAVEFATAKQPLLRSNRVLQFAVTHAELSIHLVNATAPRESWFCDRQIDQLVDLGIQTSSTQTQSTEAAASFDTKPTIGTKDSESDTKSASMNYTLSKRALSIQPTGNSGTPEWKISPVRPDVVVLGYLPAHSKPIVRIVPINYRKAIHIRADALVEIDEIRFPSGSQIQLRRNQELMAVATVKKLFKKKRQSRFRIAELTVEPDPIETS
jgi:hypothetical protein